MKVKVLALGVALLSGAAFAEEYVDLGEVSSLRCESASGRTVVHVDKRGAYHEITAIQDRRLVLLDRVPTTMLVMETFPARYLYQGRTSRKTYLSLGQTTRDFQEFSPVQGTVHYVKAGLSYRTPVTCEVRD